MVERTPPDDAWEVEAGIVRPYLFTQGRTRPALSSLAVEAMVTTTSLGRATSTTLPAEQRRIVVECRAARSVAELAAALRTPLGVVRVLIADLVATGLVDVHDTANPADDIDLLNRLIARVKAIA
jgi:DNA-directed RNA polymerase specialized sigma24 family protein